MGTRHEVTHSYTSMRSWTEKKRASERKSKSETEGEERKQISEIEKWRSAEEMVTRVTVLQTLRSAFIE